MRVYHLTDLWERSFKTTVSVSSGILKSGLLSLAEARLSPLATGKEVEELADGPSGP